MKKFLAAIAVGCAAAAAQAQLVTNGGFETGDFSGWTQWGDTGSTAIWDVNSHGGTYNAYFGPVGGFGGVVQNIAAIPGDQLHVSFWMLVESTGTPNAMNVTLDGQPVASVTDYTNTNWVEFTANITVGSANPELRFAFHNPPSYFDLDDVSVTLIPEPAAAGLLILGALMLRRR